jgi:hypothetical protein
MEHEEEKRRRFEDGSEDVIGAMVEVRPSSPLVRLPIPSPLLLFC